MIKNQKTKKQKNCTLSTPACSLQQQHKKIKQPNKPKKQTVHLIFQKKKPIA